jgi:arsenite transporter
VDTAGRPTALAGFIDDCQYVTVSDRIDRQGVESAGVEPADVMPADVIVTDAESDLDPVAALGVFGRYLTLWVALAIVVGVALGQWLPGVPDTLSRYEYASVSVPVAVLIWAMIFPMMVQIDLGSIVGVRKEPRGLVVTTTVNWLIKPFSMFAIAWFFLIVVFSPWIEEPLAREYLSGAILLGAAPCTAMVFVWSLLTRGDPAYTLVQVSVNDLIMLVAFAPIVVFLLGISNVTVPWDTVALSVVLYIVIPLLGGYAVRVWLLRTKGQQWFDQVFLKRIGVVTPTGLIFTLVLLFAFQGDVILDNPFHIVLIAVPLTIQTVFIFWLAYRWMYAWKIRHAVAAPGALIGASNFFELAVAVAIALFGLQSGAALATVVGVLVEVPVMLASTPLHRALVGLHADQRGLVEGQHAGSLLEHHLVLGSDGHVERDDLLGRHARSRRCATPRT